MNQFLCETVAEVVVARVGSQVRKRQHHDRSLACFFANRGLGRCAGPEKRGVGPLRQSDQNAIRAASRRVVGLQLGSQTPSLYADDGIDPGVVIGFAIEHLYTYEL